MADFDPDAYLTTPTKQSDSGFDPDAYLSGKADAISITPVEPADHGLSERQKLSPVQKALSPLTSYPETYKRMRNEAGEQVSKGLGQIAHPDSLIDPQGHGLSDVLSGAANTAAGVAGFAASPISAAYRSIIGQPLEDTTGIPREYSEFAAQLATPGIGLKTLAGKPKPVPPLPKPPAPEGAAPPFKTVLTEGEATGDLATRQAEQGAIRGQAGKPAQEHAEEFLNVARPEQLAEDKDTVLKSLDPTGNQVLAENPTEAANIAQQSLQKESARSKAQVKSLYDRAKALPGEIDANVFTDMPQNIKTELTNRPESVIIDDNTPVASRMINYLDNQVQQLKIKNLAQPQSTALAGQGPAPIVGVNLQGVEQWRKNLSRMRGDAIAAYSTNPSDARAARAVIEEFDSRINNAVNSGAFRGDPRAVDYYNQARAAHSARMQTWGNDAIGRRLQNIVGDVARDPASLNDVANYMYSASGTSPNSLNIGVAKRIKNILGEDSPEWAAIRQGLLHRLISTAEGVNDQSVGTVATRLSEFLNGKGSDLAKEVFTPPQRDLLNKYSELHRQLQVPQVAANWPNTAAGIIPHIKAASDKILGFIGAAIGHHIMPVAGEVAGYMAGKQAAKVFNRAEDARNLRQIAAQMPLLSQRMKVWQQAVKQQQRAASIANQSRISLAATNVASALGKIGVDQGQALRVLAGPQGPGTGEAKERAEGGAVNDDYNTFLTPEQETGFQTWKSQIAPDDSGVDYDLRGAYLTHMQKADNGHMGDQFKKPNHPTFSDQSQYATGDQADRAGFWNGDTFVPPVAIKADGGEVSDDQSDKEQAIGIHPVNPDQPPLPEVPALSPTLEAATQEGSFSKGTKIGNKLAGTGGEERYQTWPERMIRSGGALAGDVLSGEQPMLPPGLRREDYTDKPEPSGMTVAAQPNDPTYERVQDMAGLAGTGGLGGSEAGAVLNSTPSLRPALKYNGKIYKAPVGGQHLDAIPPEVYPEFQKQAMSGEDISNFNFGFMNHKGQFLDRDSAMDYAVKEGLIDPHAANQGALTSTILSDSSKSGAPLSALEHGSHENVTQAQKLFHQTLSEQYPNGVHATHESPGHVGQSFLDNGIQSDYGSFFRIGEPSDFVISPDKTRVHFKIPSKYTKDIHPDMTYGSDTTNPFYDLMLRHEGVTGADATIPQSVPPDWIYKVEHLSNGKPVQIFSDSSQAGAPVAALEHAQPFYSAVQKTVEAAPQQKMQGVQWANWLRNQAGVKPDEMQYTGLDSWLREQKGPVTKQQVQDFMQQNQVNVNDVVKDSNGEGIPKHLLEEKVDNYLDHWRDEFEEKEGHPPRYADLADRRQDLRDMITANPEDYGLEIPGATKYHTNDLVLPGGENYREHLITLPSRPELNLPRDKYAEWEKLNSNPNLTHEQSNRLNELSYEGGVSRTTGEFPKVDYKSSHWDEPNILAHVRTNDRDVGGKPALHIEELQSDWHQQGRKKGYLSGEPKGEVIHDPEGDVKYPYRVMINGEEYNRTSSAKQAQAELEAGVAATKRSGVPDAPFKTSWPELAMKRMIQKAAAEGKDRISWTPGEAQAARYDLSKHIEKIGVITEDGVKTWWPIDKRGGQHGSITTDLDGKIIKANSLWGDVAGKNIEDVVGKDVAKRGLNFSAREGTIQGADLKVGGEGMKGFYDQMLPKMVEKLGKQYGVKVKQSNLPSNFDQDDLIIKGYQGGFRAAIVDGPYISERFNTRRDAADFIDNYEPEGPKVHYFDIPPKMKEDVLSKGFPLFSDTSHGGLINQGDNNKKQIERPVEKAKTEPEINAPVNRAAGGRVLASNINSKPSEAQKSAGNYAKDHIRFQGLDITIENAKGKERSGVGKDGKRWSVKMPAHYGYIKRTEGADKDHIDVYIGPHIKSQNVYVVNQVDADTKHFDEHKILLGFGSLQQALNTYEKGFSDGKGLQRVGSIVAIDMLSLKKWLNSAKTNSPFTTK